MFVNYERNGNLTLEILNVTGYFQLLVPRARDRELYREELPVFLD